MEQQERVTAHPQRWWILAALIAALMVIVLDNTILNVVLPAISLTFDASTAELQAAVDSYVVIFAGLLIAAGAFADRYGRRRAILVGLVVFGIASLMAAMAPSMWWLIAMRGLMGVGAALIMPSTFAILVHVFPAEERASAFGAWAAVASGAIALGPVLGGFLTELWGWAAVFLVNIPVVAVGVAAVVRLVPESRDPAHRPLDLTATVLLTTGMLAMIATVIAIPERGFGAAPVLVGAGLTVVLLALFVLRQRLTPHPMVDFGLYRVRQFSAGSAAVTTLALSSGAALFILTLHLQLAQGYSALAAGLAVLPLAVGVVTGSTLTGRSTIRIGHRHTMLLGLAGAFTGLVVLSTLDPAAGYLPVAVGVLLVGFGSGFAGPAAMAIVLGSVSLDRVGVGSALNDAHQQIGIALGVAVLGSLFAGLYRAGLPPTVLPEEAKSLTVTIASAGGDAGLIAAAREAFGRAESATFLAAAAFVALGVLVTVVFVARDRPRTISSPDPDTASRPLPG